jgi:multidrug efflux pump subunit AcrB
MWSLNSAAGLTVAKAAVEAARKRTRAIFM